MLLCLPLLSQQLQLCASPPLFRVFGVSFLLLVFFCVFCPALPQLCTLLGFFFFFLVSFLWLWVSLSSFLLLSPLLEPSLLFFLLSVRSLLRAVAVTPPKKKKKLRQQRGLNIGKVRLHRYICLWREDLNIVLSYLTNVLVEMNMFRTRCMLF